ncbi:WD-repeat protein [Trichosporon asahii var. asahii CBS 2479]|uniref:WD-repeat protein n=1 Tax=Trichosporon asahii var. asahii (strain ATCC 90039 / CBS 2479 / JCM 2466 / KCTC 7840 / NBRC 103889/ NCYC 2677 / UAMH 7654) TaxID=1186058 RepID=J5R4P9_TRIAS|nr:WD-repeat protein [Trichosporon asahii var. asahii CBS 2479]EJT50688.1 WD-repeat protein [Trichosporon asahii var. asahii CBS 2479]
MNSAAGPSSPNRNGGDPSLSPRQREKAPISPDSVNLPPNADHEITLLISEYLSSRHPRLADVLAAEVGPARDHAVTNEIEGVERAILALESLLSGPGLLGPQTLKAFLYMCYRQQFLEYIDNQGVQPAAEAVEAAGALPAGAVRLLQLGVLDLGVDSARCSGITGLGGRGPRTREARRYVARVNGWGTARSGRVWRGSRCIEQSAQGPAADSDQAGLCLGGHGCEPEYEGTGEHRDAFRRLHESRDSEPPEAHGSRTSGECEMRRLRGRHDGRQRIKSYIASGSGDGTVRIWTPHDGQCRSVLAGDGGDIYGVCWRPGREDNVVAACYDKILRSWDLETGKLIRTFSGHAQSTLAVAFDPTGKIIASGSKDKHIRLWDAVGGVCVQTMTAHLGEVTSVQFDHEGKYLLAGCKDNSNRLWDLRMQRNIYRYTGHQNTSKNIIRCRFASPSCSLIASGSEDGMVYLWEREGSAPEENMRSPASNSNSGASTPAQGSPMFFTTTTGVPNAMNTSLSRTSTISVPSTTVPRGPSVASPSRSAAHYPPRGIMQGPALPKSMVPTTVRPLKVLAGHGAGAVYDVRSHAGTLLSAGEDGAVGVWGDE